MELTSESVLALAPDASSVKAAQALLKPGQWPTLGFNENAVWGESKAAAPNPTKSKPTCPGRSSSAPARAGNFPASIPWPCSCSASSKRPPLRRAKRPIG